METSWAPLVERHVRAVDGRGGKTRDAPPDPNTVPQGTAALRKPRKR